MWMNEHDIGGTLAISKHEDRPVFRSAIQYLSDYKDLINANSDGWAYWSHGTRCADKLGDLLHAYKYNSPADIRSEDLTAAIKPIKSFATRNKDKYPFLANLPVLRTPQEWEDEQRRRKLVAVLLAGDAVGMSIDTDNDGQIVLYTGLAYPEGQSSGTYGDCVLAPQED